MIKVLSNDPALSPDFPDRAPRTAAFKRWFGGSKVVDKRGKPLVVFHGSNRPFYAFDYSRWGKTDPGFAGKGFYFIDHMGYASAYAEMDAGPSDAPTVLAVYLRMENPLVVMEYGEIPGATAGRVPTREQAEDMTQRVRAMGYDGVIVAGKPGNPSEYVVFDPSQIKSATVNRGTFDAADPDIRHNPATARRNPYEAGKKYSGNIPEVRYLPVSVIYRREYDFKPETLSVSDAVARGMDYSKPIEVTAYRFAGSGWAPTSPPRAYRVEEDDDETAEVMLEDGHHRLAAAIQTGRRWLPVNLKATNAKGEKLNALIALSQQIEAQTNPSTARRTHPSLWERIVAEVTAGDKGGRPGQWSARKAQLAVALYKQRGGGYVGPKTPDNSLAKWTREQWRTRSGRPSLVTGERYLPTKALAALSPQEYGATTRAKRAGMARGQQFVPQPERIAMKTAKYRKAKRNPNYPNVSVYRGVLTSPEGRIPVKQIGKGQFSVAYLSEEPRPRVFLFTSGDVQDKEILMFAHDRLPNNPHLPAVEAYGDTRDGKTVWTMPLYKAPLKKADNETAWKQYLALKKCRANLYKPRGVKSGYEVNYDVYECAVAAGVPPKLANALEHLLNTAADYDEEYVFEFSPRNLATDAEGNLVLLDVLYHRAALFRKLGAAAARGW